MKLIPCPACEHRVSPEAPFCPGCGHPLDAAKTELVQPVTQDEPVGEVCHDCSAPATQKCCDCGNYCCVDHASFISSKRTGGFYCAACAEPKRNLDTAVFVVMLVIVIVVLLAAAG